MNKRKLNDTEMEDEQQLISSRIKSDTGELLGSFDVPKDITPEQLQLLCNASLQNEDPVPLSFYINDVELTGSLEKSLAKDFSFSESVVDIIYQPQAVFKVRAVTRCTASIEGDNK